MSSPSDRRSGPEDRVPSPGTGDGRSFGDRGDLEVALPGGGRLTLLGADEVVLWNETRDRYVSDYKITRANDLVALGAILSQILALYRAQKDLSDPKKAPAAQAMISKAADDIRKGEKALGVDKVTREKGGQHTTSDYLARLKRAAFEKGIRISERVTEYERVMMDARWKIRLLRNGDTEDRDYHKLTEKTIIDWLEVELAKIEVRDKEWSKTKGALFVGKL